MVWFLRGICKQCISRLYVYVIFKLSNPLLSHSPIRFSLCCPFSLTGHRPAQAQSHRKYHSSAFRKSFLCSGAISHDRFLKLSAEYEAEQKELEEKVKADQQEVDTYEQNKSDFDSFAAIIRKYVRIKELTPAIVNEFIKKIIVHAPEKVDGKRVQKVDIVFNFVGEINFLSATQPKRQGA